jgi:hypothetical protein
MNSSSRLGEPGSLLFFSFPLVWDEFCPSGFRLSYARLLFPPDVFPDEFVIIYV